MSKAEAKRRFAVGSTWTLTYAGPFMNQLGERTVAQHQSKAVGFSRPGRNTLSWLDFSTGTTFRESEDGGIKVYENGEHILTYAPH